MNLNTMQALLQEIIVSGVYCQQQKCFVAGGSTEQAAIESRLNIYFHAYRTRFYEAIQADYPVVCELLGEQWTNIIDCYAENYPSQSFTLNHFGADFAKFLAESSYPNKTRLADMAQFEYLLTQAFCAPDEKILSLEQLAAFKPEQWPDIVLQQAQSVYLLPSSSALIDIWHEYKQIVAPHLIRDLPVMARDLGAASGTTNKRSRFACQTPYIVIWRQDRQVKFAGIDQITWTCLSYKQLSIAELCEYMTKVMKAELVPNWLNQFLREWLPRQIFVISY